MKTLTLSQRTAISTDTTTERWIATWCGWQPAPEGATGELVEVELPRITWGTPEERRADTRRALNAEFGERGIGV